MNHLNVNGDEKYLREQKAWDFIFAKWKSKFNLNSSDLSAIYMFIKEVRNMWSDGVSKIDMLAYEPYAELIFDIATSERLNPLTIGLFGNWGSGKSTLLSLVDTKIKEKVEEPKVISITVNAWMFEGYDDAKTALMDSIVRVINENDSICKRQVFFHK